MKVNQALEILKQQKEKLPVDIETQKTWLTQTAAFIKDFFGLESDQYKFIKNFSFKEQSKGSYNSFFDVYSPNPNYDPSDKQKVAENFIEICIDTLKKKNSLYKEPKTNFLSTLSKEFVWGIIVAIFGAGIVVGHYLTDVKNFELKQDNKVLKDSLDKLLKITSPINPTNNITNDTTHPKHS